MRNQCSSVSIETRLEARGFSLTILSRTALQPTQLSIKWVKKDNVGQALRVSGG
jgi:hypothetical protein